MLNGRLPPIIANQRKHKWESLYAGPAAGKTVVVLGLGGIGGAVAAKCKQAGLYVVGVSRHGRAVPAADEVFAAGELDAVLPRADFLFVAVPHTPETENLLDRRRQALLKPGAGVINAGRAGTMDYDALADNLRGGHIGGAILDVFAPEPLPSSSALWDAPNLIITPHVAADDGDNYAAVTLDLLFQNLRRDLNGEPLQNIVRPALGY
jgi:phosphoglycerate dehydrogenase-like enzyme